MARENRSERRGRMRYGMCLNDQCSRCKSKEVQQIPPRKELVCEECGKPLRECPPPPTGPNKKMIIGIIIAILLCGIGISIGVKHIGKDSPGNGPGGDPDTIVVDPDTLTLPPPLTEPDSTETTTPKGVKLSFGSYTGGQRDGYPNGTGTVIFTRQHTFKTSSGDLTVYPGETLTGTFRDGMLNHGELTQRNGNPVMVKGIRIK